MLKNGVLNSQVVCWLTGAVNWLLSIKLSDTIFFLSAGGYLICGIVMLVGILSWLFLKWRKVLLLNQQKLEKANEMLVSELNHRVKNNLQIAISLLRGQADYEENAEIAEAINDGCNRLYVMSLAFHSLYNGELLSAIPMEDYLDKLIFYLADEFENRQGIIIESDIAPCSLAIEMAVPIGLIISEAVSNAFKFAFPAGHTGQIKIELKKMTNVIILSISDNGVGLPEKLETSQGQAFGLSLIKGLGKQLSARVNIENAKGVTVSVEIESPGDELTSTKKAT